MKDNLIIWTSGPDAGEAGYQGEGGLNHISSDDFSFQD